MRDVDGVLGQSGAVSVVQRTSFTGATDGILNLGRTVQGVQQRNP
jgi:hypothetical protein